MDLVNKLWNFCHTLRHEGVDYSDYIEELTYLLFLKLAAEKQITVPDNCTWTDLVDSKDTELLSRYNSILRELSNQTGILKDIFSEPIAKIHNSSSLRKLLNLIDEVNWSGYDQDVLGATFEGLLERAASESKKGAGQYFTPRPLIQCIVNVMKPDPFESPNFRISDIACGTAGFLTESYEWWKSKNVDFKFSSDQYEKLRRATYFGQELVIRPRRLALMNLYLHGIEPLIILGDTIYEPLPADNLYTCILTNPPFGTKGASQIPDRNFKVKTSNKQLNFIQHAFEILEDGGRAAIVLPDSVLYEDKAADVWEHLMQLCNVHTILKLPVGTFQPYANVKAIVIFFQKGITTENTWIYDGRSNVGSVTKSTRPLSAKYFAEFIEVFGSDPNGTSKRIDQGKNGRFRKFAFDFVKARGFKLDIGWLKEDTSDDLTTVGEPRHLISSTISELESVIEELREISNMLESDEA